MSAQKTTEKQALRIQEMETALRKRGGELNALELRMKAAEGKAQVATARFESVHGRATRLRRTLQRLVSALDTEPTRVREALREARGVLQSEDRIGGSR